MSSSDLAVSVRGLSKAYTISHDQEKHITLAETILSRLKNPLRKPTVETFWALKDVNFDIKKGQVIAIVGRNGAGKSTLLKVLSRITEPTTGEIDLHGRVGSLLEVGTGFHPELTGKENIFLNGAILGMSKTEISQQFDAIVDFAGVEKFIDTPVKRYSSGMYVRLAFAVAAHLDPEILIIDEVLAVGDAEFQRKCLGKMKDVSESGRTVLFVSHNVAAIRALCTGAILLKEGQVVGQGAISPVLEQYLSMGGADRSKGVEFKSSVPGLALRDIYFVDNETGEKANELYFGKDYELRLMLNPGSTSIRAAALVTVWDQEGSKISTLATAEEGVPFFDLSSITAVKFSVPDVALAPGTYRLSVNICDEHTVYLSSEFAASMTIEARCIGDAPWSYNRSHGYCRFSRGASIEQT